MTDDLEPRAEPDWQLIAEELRACFHVVDALVPIDRYSFRGGSFEWPADKTAISRAFKAEGYTLSKRGIGADARVCVNARRVLSWYAAMERSDQ